MPDEQWYIGELLKRFAPGEMEFHRKRMATEGNEVPGGLGLKKSDSETAVDAYELISMVGRLSEENLALILSERDTGKSH